MHVCVCEILKKFKFEKEESIEGGLGSQYIGWEAVY